MAESKAWDWKMVNDSVWLSPCEDSHYLAARWREKGYRTVLDLGCGLGRHAVFFARQGFAVQALDLSPEGVKHLQEWTNREGLDVDASVGDMLDLPYADASMDCVFAYHVISHADTAGVRRIVGEIGRVMKPGGEFFLSMCSKDSLAFREGGYPALDANTIVKTDEGPEKGVPHYYASLEDILELFGGFHIENVKHVDHIYHDGMRHSNIHYYLLGAKTPLRASEGI